MLVESAGHAGEELAMLEENKSSVKFIFPCYSSPT